MCQFKIYFLLIFNNFQFNFVNLYLKLNFHLYQYPMPQMPIYMLHTPNVPFSIFHMPIHMPYTLRAPSSICPVLHTPCPCPPSPYALSPMSPILICPSPIPPGPNLGVGVGRCVPSPKATLPTYASLCLSHVPFVHVPSHSHMDCAVPIRI
jgi:hypothetical protein